MHPHYVKSSPCKYLFERFPIFEVWRDIVTLKCIMEFHVFLLPVITVLLATTETTFGRRIERSVNNNSTGVFTNLGKKCDLFESEPGCGYMLGCERSTLLCDCQDEEQKMSGEVRDYKRYEKYNHYTAEDGEYRILPWTSSGRFGRCDPADKYRQCVKNAECINKYQPEDFICICKPGKTCLDKVEFVGRPK